MNYELLEELKETRIQRGLTQNDVAKKIGVKDNTISNYEKGKTEPDIETLVKICEIYEISYTKLLKKYYNNEELDSASDFSLNEQTHINKYRQLDPHGKDMVDTVLHKEYERTQSQSMHTKISMAAKGKGVHTATLDEKTTTKFDKIYNDADE